MNLITEKSTALSRICIELCGGRCCDPWWGVILYTMTKKGGLSNLNTFKNEVIRGINSRVERIKTQYITNEDPPRLLFKDPDRYNVVAEKIQIVNDTLIIHLRAMFAFRCLFLSQKKVCLIHPSKMGVDIRPPHCALLGSAKAKAGDKGFCRIIDAAFISHMDEIKIASGIEVEREVSQRHFDEGCTSADEAAELAMRQIQEYCARSAAHLMPSKREKKPGRNDPCYCGSDIKYKRCHGRLIK
jgi:Fe-S-cluster containining protein